MFISPEIFQQSGEQLGLTVRIDFFDDPDRIHQPIQSRYARLGRSKLESDRDQRHQRRSLPETGESVSFLNYLSPATRIVAFWAPLEIAEQAKSYLDRLPEVKGIYPLAAVLRLAGQFTRMELSQFDQAAGIGRFRDCPAHSARAAFPSARCRDSKPKRVKPSLNYPNLTKTHDVTIFCENDGEKKRFSELTDQAVAGLSAKINIVIGYLHRGFVWQPDAAQALSPSPCTQGEGGPAVSHVEPGEGSSNSSVASSRRKRTLT